MSNSSRKILGAPHFRTHCPCERCAEWRKEFADANRKLMERLKLKQDQEVNQG